MISLNPDMNIILLLAVILVVSVLSCKLTSKTGLPVLVGFILVGILIGTRFDIVNPTNAEHVCNVALLFIIFTGGFQTDFAHAKPVLGVSLVMASAGTALTSVLAAVFAYFVLGLEFHAAMLLGAVISATDAASVFSILSSKKINLKNNLGSVLELESGTNDPFAYMLTVVFLGLATGGSENVAMMIVMQITLGAAVGFVVAILGRRMMNRLNLDISGLYAVLLLGVAMLMYGAAGMFGGNGFLAVYIGGMILGNVKLAQKSNLSELFSALSMLMQIILFIVLGILWVPSSFWPALPAGLAFAAAMFFVVRPVVLFFFMKPFRYKIKEIALVSWAGFRGASSIVFSSYLLSAGLPYAELVFSIVFSVCLLSVIIQGSLLSPLAKLFNLVEPEKTLEEKAEKPMEGGGK